MGRYKRYITDEEKKEAKRRWNHEYYMRNKKRLDKRAKERYLYHKYVKIRKYV